MQPKPSFPNYIGTIMQTTRVSETVIHSCNSTSFKCHCLYVFNKIYAVYKLYSYQLSFIEFGDVTFFMMNKIRMMFQKYTTRNLQCR